MEKDQLEIYYRLFNHNQETVYYGSYDMGFKPSLTDKGKLKYESKVDGVNQTRHLKRPFKLDDITSHLIANIVSGDDCDENGIIDNKMLTGYGKKVITKTQIGKHMVQNELDLGVVLNSLGPDGRGIFAAIDVDIYDNQELLEKVVKQIYSENIPLVPCYSKSNGLHLYLFSKEPLNIMK